MITEQFQRSYGELLPLFFFKTDFKKLYSPVLLYSIKYQELKLVRKFGTNTIYLFLLYIQFKIYLKYLFKNFGSANKPLYRILNVTSRLINVFYI